MGKCIFCDWDAVERVPWSRIGHEAGHADAESIEDAQSGSFAMCAAHARIYRPADELEGPAGALTA
jgi:hypothetical protein